MQFDIVTIFPGFFEGFLSNGILTRALSNGIASVAIHDLRAFTHDRHKTVDDRPFGGGEGMVLKPGPIFECFESLNLTPKATRDSAKETVILLSAQGRPFTQTIAHELAAVERIVFLCGRYEGVDERVNDLLCDRELSIGDYVLSGGELGAAVIIDSIARLLPGVLGNPDSARFESFGTHHAPEPHTPGLPPASTNSAGGLLDYPHYTRPADFRGHSVPDVLTGGSHEAVRRWRRERALEKTLRNRPDLLEQATLTEEDRRTLNRLRNSSPKL
ncbi:tRNA (guanosine(37)-N1)-methyltransferase TrmD [Granulicella arctica]|uniref:tRNA (guanine-N(1)-)-methyltransferase n=1 Tax=Granulicella arctica TaxID=940613 RepID=A0A7Y9TI23_9BACT|nr:tRNA (guanosine(37)-N1)-methyltransferase TrmD [Granulicella arctica]NYF80545.1 tRNA (guanine37-N1)-methyltransferase [Granulicella arctica]